MSVKNQVQLITYPDSLGGNLNGLNNVLEKYFSGLFTGGVHILPPFPSSGDRGFAPLTYFEIDPKFGSWSDIQHISEKHAVLLDLMVNHISAQSEYFQDFIVNGKESKYANLFFTLDKFWPNGIPVEEDLKKIFLRRTVPYSEFKIKNTGQTEKVWTTFGKTTPSEQIDLDVNSQEARDLLINYMKFFGEQGVKIVRLDAVGYVTKKRGSSCFFVEPEIYQFLDWISGVMTPQGIDLLPEIHADFETQFKLANKGYWIYDFILPYLVLDAFFNKTSKRLIEYLKIRPQNQFTTLDCHDGIPVKPDLNGRYNYEDARNVVDVCLQRGGNLSMILSPEHKDANGFDVHQIRGTLYSLFGENDATYLAARALQLFTPGIPQVYYVGLLAGKNDEARAIQTGDGREINRHNFSLEEIDQAVQKPVVKKLMQLIQLRNTHPAFNGTFTVWTNQDHQVSLDWKKDEQYASLYIDLQKGCFTVKYSDPVSGIERQLGECD